MSRMFTRFITGILVTTACFHQNYSLCQETTHERKHARPVVDIENVSPGAYYTGKIRIKLQHPVTGLDPESEIHCGLHGFVVTGNQAIDSLNSEFDVKKITPLFWTLYKFRSKSLEYKSRHKAWGLHLWFEVCFDEETDIVEVVNKYSSLAEVEIAEPEFIKQLVINESLIHTHLSVSACHASPEPKWIPDDPLYSNQWHYNNTGQQGGTAGADIRLQDAWNIHKGNNNVIVAVIDGGIDHTHQDIAGNMWPGLGYNFVTGSSLLSPHNHGTHVAGTIAAVNSNATGTSGIAGGSGINDGVRLMSCQVFTNTSNGGFHLAPVFAADNGASVSQNSWSYTSAGVCEQLVIDAIDYFNANGGGSAMNGGITIFAAGNNNSMGPWYPACYSGCFAVAATNNLDQKAWYSNYDSWIDISAPGGETNVVAARGVLSTLTGNSYGYYQGTSMACPHVSGVAALMLSAGFGKLDADEVEDELKNTADNHYNVNPEYAGKLGAGRLNAYAALTRVQEIISGVRRPGSFAAQATSSHQINLSWIKNLQNNDVMVVWSDTNVFGDPQSGMVYSPGQVLPGGGIVLYKGELTYYSHTALEQATTYYYKAFSYNEINEYSNSRSANAVTFCDAVGNLPFIQDFNCSYTAPTCWNVFDYQGNNQVWKFGITAGGLYGSTGNYAYVNSDAYGAGYTQNTDLISPTFDFSNHSNISISFLHYFRSYPGSAGTLSYSTDNGDTWTQLQQWTSTTSNPESYYQIITQLAGKAAVKFKWNYTGTWAYWWCVDDVQINGSELMPLPDFTADKTTAYAGEAILFTDASTGGIFTSWEWNFGAGATPPTATGQGPHQVMYSITGNKTVSLLVDNQYLAEKPDYIQIIMPLFSSSATYTSGDIPTDKSFTNISGQSSCPGIFGVTIPESSVITGADVSYQMTARSSGRMNHQRSQLRCVSPGGLNEQVISTGVGNMAGTYTYNRTNLNIANGVSGGGEILFELHAGRTSLGSGCNTTYNKVDNNSWTITVHYQVVLMLPPGGSTVVYCPDDAISPVPPEVTDHCGQNLIPVLLDVVDDPIPLTCQGTRTYHYQYTDCLGNTDVWSFIYYIEYHDFEIPQYDTGHAACSEYLPEIIPPLVFDNCGNEITPTGPEVSEIPECRGLINYTWKYTDCAGNEHPWVYTLILVDDQCPVLTGTLPGGYLDNTCMAEMPAAPVETFIASLYNDNCVTVFATLINTAIIGNDCGWSVTYTYSVADGCGNIAPNASINYYGANLSPINLVNPLLGCSSLNMYDLLWCLSEAESFDAGSLENEIANLYTDGCGQLTASLQETIPGLNNSHCQWDFTFVYEVTNPCFQTVTCFVNYSGGDSLPPYLVNQEIDCSTLNQTGLNWNYSQIQAFDATYLEDIVANMYSDNCSNITVSLISSQIEGANQNWLAAYDFSISDECNNAIVCQVIYSGSGQPEVPQMVILNDQQVGFGDDICFNATKIIDVQGINIHPGGVATLIAGQSIVFHPGSKVQAGGFMHAYISNVYCTIPLALIAAKDKEIPTPVVADNILKNETPFMIYPNPTAGIFTLEFPDPVVSSAILAELYNVTGERLIMNELPAVNKHLFDITLIPKGVYLLRVTIDHKSGIARIVKY